MITFAEVGLESHLKDLRDLILEGPLLGQEAIALLRVTVSSVLGNGLLDDLLELQD